MFRIVIVFCLLAPVLCYAQQEEAEFPRLILTGLLDVRFAKTDDPVSWLNGELGKTRYGGSLNGSADLFRLSQASVLVTAALQEDLSARIQLNIDAEPDKQGLRGTIDVVEGFISYRPLLNSSLRLKLRGGIFFPPISLENRSSGWTTPYTITTSAINSWIGEEVRPTGVETILSLSIGSEQIDVGAALFGNNDPAGSLLAWRGWAMHDRQSGVSDNLPLAAIPSIQPDGLFPDQPPFVEPFREVDGRIGYYAVASWKNRRFELNGIYYANRGDPAVFDGTQYAWNTDFVNLGFFLPLPNNFEFLGQLMQGESKMGFGDMVDIDFTSAYALLSFAFGRNRITGRYDDFDVEDQDAFVTEDNNKEDGDAWTFCYSLLFAEKHRLAVELLRVRSRRAVRADLRLPVTETEYLFQTSFRLRF